MADKFELKAVLSAVDKMSPALKNIARTARSTRKYLGDVGKSMGGLSGAVGFGALGAGVLGGFSAVGIKNAVVGLTEYADEVKKAALATGMTTDQIQRMKYVGSQAGVSFEAVTDGVGKLNKNLAEVSHGGGGELASLLKHLGIATRDANGHLRGGADMLPKLADAFTRNTNPILQARMGVAAFGKSWKEILPLLIEGSAGIEKSQARLAKIKGVISAADLQAAKDFGDQLEDVSIVTKGFGFTIAKELIPTLSPLVEQFIQWAAANKKVIAQNVKQVVNDLVNGLKSYDWEGFIATVKDMAHSFGRVVDFVGGAKNALIGLVVVMNANAIMATAGLIGSLGRLILFLGGVGFSATASAMQLMGFAASAEAAGVMLIAGLKSLAVSASLLAAAAGIGYAIGTVIYDNFIKNTKFDEWLGEQLARVMAFFGSEDAKAALKVTAAQKETVQNAPRPAPVTGAVKETVQAASNVAAAQKEIVQNAPRPVPASDAKATPADRTSSSILNTVVSRISGEVAVTFNNAPAGMRVERAESTGGVVLNPMVGYRSFATGMP